MPPIFFGMRLAKIQSSHCSAAGPRDFSNLAKAVMSRRPTGIGHVLAFIADVFKVIGAPEAPSDSRGRAPARRGAKFSFSSTSGLARALSSRP